MNIENSEEGYLFSLTCDQGMLFVEVEVLLENDVRAKWIAFNASSAPIKIEFEGFCFMPWCTTTGNVPCLGEIEAVVRTGTGFTLEGDFGLFCVTADRVEYVNQTRIGQMQPNPSFKRTR